MRQRLWLVPVLAGLLIAAGCSSSGSAPRTVTVLNTVTGNETVPATTTQSTIQVGTPSESAAPSPTSSPDESPSESPTETEAPESSATGTAVPGIDPLSVACTTLLEQDDVENTIGADIRSGAVKRPDVADPERDVTGKSRCRYGSNDDGKTGQVTVLLTTYGSAASAAKQIGLTVDAEKEEGAKVSELTVDGFPAWMMLRQGGLIVVQYDTWTMTIAVQDKLSSEEQLTTGLPELATIVLKRIVKNG